MIARHRSVTGRYAVTLGAAAVLVAGCTGDPSPEETAPDADGGTAPAGPDADDPQPEGPTPEELSAEILAGAEAAGDVPAVASVTAEVAGDTFTLDVVAVRRTAGATAVEVRLSAPDGPTGVGVARFNEGRFDSPSFVRAIVLEVDPGDGEAAGSGTRYYPWAFEDHRQACLCPVLPLELDAEPITVHALYPPLPDDVDAVDVTLTEDLTAADVPVTSDSAAGAAGTGTEAD